MKTQSSIFYSCLILMMFLLGGSVLTPSVAQESSKKARKEQKKQDRIKKKQAKKDQKKGQKQDEEEHEEMSSKDAEKVWKDKAKAFIKQPLALKEQVESYQAEVETLKEENKVLERARLDQIDSLHSALASQQRELSKWQNKNALLEKAIAESKQSEQAGVRRGLIYRIKLDGSSGHVLGQFRTREDAQAFQGQLETMGLTDGSTIVPFIDGVEASDRELSNFEQNAFSEKN